MTVSQIASLAAPEIKRAQDAQNKPPAAQQTQVKNAPQSATLPSDNVTSAAPRDGLDADAARLATEAQNVEAAASTLSDADFETASANNTPSAPAQVEAQPASAVKAQTAKLPPGILELLTE